MAEVVSTLVALAVLGAIAYVAGVLLSSRGEGWRDWVSMRTRHRRAASTPSTRPIEDIAADLRRLGRRFHALNPHASYAKVEAVRSAYDRALTECCTALGLTHLLGVLPAGPELDAERSRVEGLLAASGVELPNGV